MPLYADLHDLRLKSSYDTIEGGRYYGDLGYRDGHLKYGAYAPIVHDLQAEFDARRSGVAFNNVTLTTPPMVAKLNATIQELQQSDSTRDVFHHDERRRTAPGDE